jgi:superfamily I DNA/RNA helicase
MVSYCYSLLLLSGMLSDRALLAFNLLAGLRRRWKHILVDEWQDINLPQYRLVQLLAKGHSHEFSLDTDQEGGGRSDACNAATVESSNTFSSIYVVGDDDQRIYGWRGAVVDVVRNFFDHFQDCQIFALEPNFRCTKVHAYGWDSKCFNLIFFVDVQITDWLCPCASGDCSGRTACH